MPIVDLKPYIEDADVNGYAIGCFNIINLESIDGVIKAAENLNSPVCITFHPPHFKYTSIEIAANAARAAAEKTHVPVILHLDNASELSQVLDAIKHGFTSIMYTGHPEMDFNLKIEKTKIISDIVHSKGLVLESDVCLNRSVSKLQDIDTYNSVYIDSAVKFCDKTGVDILSADILRTQIKNGDRKASVDFDILKKLKTLTKKYLSLHGGSGIDDETLKGAFKAGINKMHIYGRSADRAVLKIKKSLENERPDIIKIMYAQREGFREIVEDSIKIFGSANKLSNSAIINAITEAVINRLNKSGD